MNNAAPAVELRGATRRYPGVLALDGADFTVGRGEVRALLGKNGAGKSTLIRLLTGAELPDEGVVRLSGVSLSARGRNRAREAASLGLRAVYQELSLIPEMTVAENLFLGSWPSRLGAIDRHDLLEAAAAALERLGLVLDPRRIVSSLTPAERQLVEIARAFLFSPATIILDEPTSSLAAAEVDQVVAAVTTAAAAGIAVIYVSHRMDEIRRLASAATVMRDGRVVGTMPLKNTATSEIIRLMLGSVPRPTPRAAAKVGHTVLSVRGLAMRPKLRQIDFDLRAGEVLGIAGLLGSGRTETLEGVAGLRGLDAGEVSIEGHTTKRPRYRTMLAHGLGFAPEDRKERGTVPFLGVDENTVLTDTRPISRAGVLNRRKVGRAASRIIERLGVRTARPTTPIVTLSGGNQQKVVIGRWIHAGSRILLLDEPTRGVDVEAKVQIYDLIRALAAEGRAIVFVSSEIEELDQVCDRVIVLREGVIVAEHAQPDLTPETLLAACLAG